MRRLALVFAFALAAFVAVPASASHPAWGGSAGIHFYDFIHSTSVWKDRECGDGYAVMLYSDAGFGGSQTRVCHGYTSDGHGWACDAPMSGGFHQFPVTAFECESGATTAYTLENKVSSLKVLSGFTAGRCFVIFNNKDWGGIWRQFDKDTEFSNLGSIGFNDMLTSWKIDDCSGAQTVW